MGFKGPLGVSELRPLFGLDHYYFTPYRPRLGILPIVVRHDRSSFLETMKMRRRRRRKRRGTRITMEIRRRDV